MKTNDTNRVALVAGGSTASSRWGNIGPISSLILPGMKASAPSIIGSVSGA